MLNGKDYEVTEVKCEVCGSSYETALDDPADSSECPHCEVNKPSISEAEFYHCQAMRSTTSA